MEAPENLVSRRAVSAPGIDQQGKFAEGPDPTAGHKPPAEQSRMTWRDISCRIVYGWAAFGPILYPPPPPPGREFLLPLCLRFIPEKLQRRPQLVLLIVNRPHNWTNEPSCKQTKDTDRQSAISNRILCANNFSFSCNIQFLARFASLILQDWNKNLLVRRANGTKQGACGHSRVGKAICGMKPLRRCNSRTARRKPV